MKFNFASLAVAALSAQVVVGDSWFGKTAYNKWHETELERWLSDHNVPYPSPYDRKQLEDLVKKNWNENVARPYNSWDTNQLSHYITSRGKEIKKGTEKNKDSLVEQVQSYWHETADQASESYHNVQSWIFDTWTESQLKAFLDYHHIPNPSPRTRDSLLHTARSNYQSAATKAGETLAYPGNWLWQSWSESDLKLWLDERGIPNPQPSSRDKLIASVRRHSKLASDRAASQYASLSASAANAQQSLSDQLLDSWSDSQIKDWCDRNGVKVPQGTRRNELIALARKHYASLSGNNVASSASSAFGAATSSAGNLYPQVTNDIYYQARDWYNWAANQIGMASDEAKSSLSSASVRASSSLSSASSRASVESSKLSVAASKSASSASKEASKSGLDAASAASSAAREATRSASSAAKEAASSASSAAKVAASSASSAGKQATRSAKNEL